MNKVQRLLQSNRPLIMGILNLSPDSPVNQSVVTQEEALKRATILQEQGAHIIDVGGNSSSSKAEFITTDEERLRVIPAIKRLVENDFVVSIDSWNPIIVDEAANVGVHMINDINGLEKFEMRKISKEFDLPVSIMHMRGEPKKHYEVNQNYSNIVIEIQNWLKKRVEELLESGIDSKNIIVDPGFGFGKSMQDNLKILRNLSVYKNEGFPLLVSASRKSFIAEAIGLGKTQKGEGLFEATMAVQLIAMEKGADILRVHDVRSTNTLLRFLQEYQKL